MSDIYKFRDIVAQANQSKQQVTESDSFEGTPEQAGELAAELEQYTEDIMNSLESIERLVRQHMPRKYRYLESYTFASFKTLIGGHGYVDRMNPSLKDLIEELQEYADNGGMDDEEDY
jgi:hypothetical protein